MGAFQTNTSNSTIINELKYVQAANIPNTNDYPPGSDPLRFFIKHKIDQEAKVKTFSDVQMKSDRLISKSMVRTNKLNKSSIKQSDSTFKKESHNAKIQPTPTISIIKENKQNSLVNSTTRNLKNSVSKQRDNDLKNTFRTVSINSDSFIKIRQEQPSDFYEFQEMIGQGSYGQVFKALCKKTQELRAIKVLKTKFMKDREMKNFLAEMTLLSKLNHPSIVNLYDLFRYQRIYYVVMEYCDGGSVVEMINKITFKSEQIIANIMKQLFRALSYMHSLGIIHRDIKLENIVFLNSKSKDKGQIPIKIIDFGTAVKSQYKVVQNYPIAGTLSYLAPQVMKGILCDKSDLWSSGVLMFILLTGVCPFKGKNQYQTKENINSKELNYISSPLNTISNEAKDLLQKLLNRNMYKRISAIQALNHPWLSEIKNEHTISITNLEKLQNYYVNSKFTQRGNNLISVIESYLSLRKVTQEERQKLASIFTKIDQDGNGLIEREELVHILQNNIQSFNKFEEKEINSLVDSIDKNSSGKIDFNEFIIAMYDKEKIYVRQSLNEAFEYFDKDHTGFIEMQELKSILHGGDAAEVEYFIHKIDQDNDRRISRDQFISYLLAF